jgi:hypothetical protein
MCDCKIGWVEDSTVPGEHNLMPVSCAEYIRALEEQLDKVSADKVTFLDVRALVGFWQRKTPEPGNT